MPGDYGGFYDTGTISVANGETTVTGTLVNWSDFADGLDMLVAGGSMGAISTVVGIDVITLVTPWAGTTLVDQPYVILKASPLRVITPSALLGDQVRALLQRLAGAGIVYTVAGAPDPGVGNDGDYALDTSTLPWTLWLKVTGDWERQTQWVPFTPKGAWSSSTSYVIGDFVQHGNGNFVSSVNPNLNHAPDSTPPLGSDAFWTFVPLPGVSEVLAALGVTNITISTDLPSGGVNGDLWFRVDS